jgi:hypothetical protein
MENSKTKPQAARKYFSLLLFITIISSIAFTHTAQGQVSYKIAEGSKITVSGTSNLHDWTMLASNFLCEANLKVKSGQVQDLSSMSFTLPVTNLKSKEALMDTRAYKALKSEQFNKILFKLTDATILSQQKTIKATGSLTIAGVTKEITIQGAYIISNDDILTLTGTQAIKLSDYSIKAPSFMLGALKVGNEVSIDIALKLKRTNLLTQVTNPK